MQKGIDLVAFLLSKLLRSRLIEWFGCTPDANKGD